MSRISGLLERRNNLCTAGLMTAGTTLFDVLGTSCLLEETYKNSCTTDFMIPGTRINAVSSRTSCLLEVTYNNFVQQI